MQYGLVPLSNLTVDNFVPLILALYVGLKIHGQSAML